MGWMKELHTFAQEERLPLDTPLDELYALYMASQDVAPSLPDAGEDDDQER